MFHLDMSSPLKGAVIVSAMMLAVGMSGCDSGSNAKYTITFPDDGTVSFQGTVTTSVDFWLEGMVPIGKLGTLTFTPPAVGGAGFGFNLNLSLDAFLPGEWTGSPEVTTLPTGAPFPTWVVTPLVMISASDKWNAYIGIQGERYIGASSGFVDGQNVPQVTLSFIYRDKDGKVVLGVQAYPPKSNDNGTIAIPGGVFVATDLSQFGSSTKMDIMASLKNGNAKLTSIEVSGPDAHKYRSQQAILSLIQIYSDAAKQKYDHKPIL